MFFSNIFAFSNPERAFAFNERSVKMNMVMVVGNEFWVVSPAEAQRINRLGYKYANR